MGDRECYFFCRRGRKYRNSIRPNRVTGSGFWKATGIDKPIYSSKDPLECIGLKKSLVYYRGSAGKGTKTDWMMNEFRLPPNGKSTTNFLNAKDNTQEAVRLHSSPFLVFLYFFFPSLDDHYSDSIFLGLIKFFFLSLIFHGLISFLIRLSLKYYRYVHLYPINNGT